MNFSAVEMPFILADGGMGSAGGEYVSVVAFNYLRVFSALISMGVSCLLIVTYFNGFMIPKSKLFDGKLTFVIFGGAYYLAFLGLFILTEINLLTGSALVVFGVLMCIVFILSRLLFRPNLYLLVFLTISFFAVREISFLMTTSIQVQFDAVPLLPHHTSLFQFFLFLLLYSVLNYMILRYIRRSYLHKIRLISRSELMFLILPCLAGLCLVFIIRTTLEHTVGTFLLFRDAPLVTVLVIAACLFLLFGILASIKLFQNLIESFAAEKEQVVLQKQMQQLQEQIHDVDGIYTEIRGMRHDMKSHLTNIKLLAVSGDKQDKLDEYLGKFEETLNRFDFAHKTGNAVSDIIIHQNYLEARKNSVKFTSDFAFPSGMSLDAYDLAIILNNALENALEACKTLDAPRRFIRLYSYVKGEMFFIEIENSASAEPLFINRQSGLPVSSKQDDRMHGMGLSNIRRCARKHLGDIDIKHTNNENGSVFRLNIMLQNKKEAVAGVIPQQPRKSV